MTWLVRAACALVIGGTLAAQSIELQVAMPPGGVAFGEAFDVVVTRSGTLGELEPFDESALAPLQVVLQAMETRPHDRWMFVTESLRYRARCFATGEVQVGPLTMKSRAVDRELTATSGQLLLNVRSSLPDPAGGFEWPGDVRDLASATRWPWLAAVAALLLTCVWWWRRPRAAAESAIADVQPAAHTALRELRALAVPGDGADAAAVVAFHQDVKRLVRQHCRERFAIPADVRTSEELLRAVPANEHAAACLLACDLVLFAAVLPPSVERARTLAAAIVFAEERA